MTGPVYQKAFVKMHYGNSLLCHRHWEVSSEPAGVPLSMLEQVDFTAFQSCIPSVYVVPGVSTWMWGICGSVCEEVGSGGL